ncbi:GNAT family N-acetyltransferase [Roseiarcus sp.]|uniref:GNAT family N-acetyltransferase n=1 Tax=Roseiarcus sp. TaxID=1969460 RepID=UPI003F99C132
MEAYGSEALLRSIVVAADARGEGVGRKVVDWLLAHSARQGAQCAFLFTTDACAYLEGLGFEVADSGRAPRRS